MTMKSVRRSLLTFSNIEPTLAIPVLPEISTIRCASEPASFNVRFVCFQVVARCCITFEKQANYKLCVCSHSMLSCRESALALSGYSCPRFKDTFFRDTPRVNDTFFRKSSPPRSIEKPRGVPKHTKCPPEIYNKNGTFTNITRDDREVCCCTCLFAGMERFLQSAGASCMPRKKRCKEPTCMIPGLITDVHKCP